MANDIIKIKIKRFDKTLPLPVYKTNGAAAIDLCARKTVMIAPQSIGYVPVNIAIKLPPNNFALMAARSSLHKKGLMMANGIGIGDEDFSGNNDEYHAILFNFTKKSVAVEKGDRITQMIILRRDKVILEEVEELDDQDRGGIGSTGF